jgi:hypothetical protein
MWPSAALGCGNNTGPSCGSSGEICLTKPTNAMGACIWQKGDHLCPSSFPNKPAAVYFDGAYNDTRTCEVGACGCSSPTGGTCSCQAAGFPDAGPPSCTIELYSDGACGTTPEASIPMNGKCWPLQSGTTQSPLSAKVVGAVPSGGSCATTGSASMMGAITPTGAVTVCCQ